VDAVDWKDRSPMVERIVRGTIRSEDEAERSRAGEYVLYTGNALQQWR